MSDTEYRNWRLDYDLDQVCWLSIDRAGESNNSLSREVMTELEQIVTGLEKNPPKGLVLQSGKRNSFIVGADVREFEQVSNAEEAAGFMAEAHRLFNRIESLDFPTVAAIDGYCLGGGLEVVCGASQVFASVNAKFGQPEIKIGVTPGAGGTQRLTKAIGKARAMELVLMGRFISAEEAYEFGLINKIVPVELYLEEALSLANEIASMSPIAAQLAKESVNRSFETHLDEGLTLERKNFYLAFSSEDQKEGMKAFVEKRKPNYKGK